MSEKRKKREYSEGFRHQMVTLYNSEKPASEIIKEYELTPSAFRYWVKRINTTGSSKIADNRSSEEIRLVMLPISQVFSKGV